MARAGLFKDRVKFQRMTATPDDFGNVTVDSWTDYLSRSADLVERAGTMNDDTGAFEDVAKANMRVRTDSAVKLVTLSDRVIARNTTWAIKSITSPTSKNDLTLFVLEKGVAA